MKRCSTSVKSREIQSPCLGQCLAHHQCSISMCWMSKTWKMGGRLYLPIACKCGQRDARQREGQGHHHKEGTGRACLRTVRNAVWLEQNEQEDPRQVAGDVNRLVSHRKDFGLYSGPHEEPVVGFEQRRDVLQLTLAAVLRIAWRAKGRTQARWSAVEAVTSGPILFF